jgi:hypothetical protein
LILLDFTNSPFLPALLEVTGAPRDRLDRAPAFFWAQLRSFCGVALWHAASFERLMQPFALNVARRSAREKSELRGARWHGM